MSSRTSVSLINFFVFNSTYGPREGQEAEKILYYYPPDVNIDSKIKNVGLCEAITKFTGTFTDKPCQSMHTEKSRQLFFQPEENFWVIMTVSIPSNQLSRDGHQYTEYHDDDVQDTVYLAVLRQAYHMFRLFMGTFQNIITKAEVDGLKQRLDHFYSRYLLTVKWAQADLLDIFNGIQFLPLDKNTYLKIQSFINLLEASFPQIKYTAFLYGDQLVWSGLEQDDMRVTYHYLTTSLIPTQQDQELKGQSSGGQPVSSTGHYGRYITGPPSLNDETNMGKIPRVFVCVDADGEVEECHLLVYKALGAVVCLLIEGSYNLSYDYLRRLDSFMGPKMSALASEVGEQYSKRPPSSSSDVQFKYVYFNHMNLATKTTVHTDMRKSPHVNIPMDVLRSLADLNCDLSRMAPVEDGEIIIKTCTDYWIVSKKSDQREFYVILNQKNANLIEINDEVKRLCSAHFSNIFFLD